MEKEFARLIGINDQKEQVIALESLLNEIFSRNLSSTETLNTISSKLLSDEVNQQTSKTLLLFFCKYLQSRFANFSNKSLLEEVFTHTIVLIKQHSGQSTIYDESDYVCRDQLFNFFVSCEQFSDAAKVLSMINLDSSTLNLKEVEKADILIKCSESYLEDDETVDAEAFVTRASQYMNSVSTEDVKVHLRYRTTFARILDANRKFVEAASRYYELSTTNFANINQDDLLMLLGKAVTCALLGKTGNHRNRIISLLCKDERLQNLQQFPQFQSHASLLLKMNNLELLPSNELLILESSLMPHQKAVTSEGFTILQKAVLEHNMLATQAIYDNISFEQLALILNLDINAAIKVAAKMITEEHLNGYIDQTEQSASFSGPLRQWDAQISVLCEEITSFVDISQTNYPELVL